jgi:DNA-binding NarL/FixJ family response regulator/acyl dehydratase
VSDWITVDQARIDLFAQATGDHQWIHVDVDRAKAGPFGAPVAHGFLTLSLLPEMAASAFAVDDVRMGVNYGLNRVRFPAPVPAGSRVRWRFKLLAYEPIAGAAVVEVTIEREGSESRRMAESVTRRFVWGPSLGVRGGAGRQYVRALTGPRRGDGVLLIGNHLILSALQSVIQGLGDHVTVVGVASARAARETLRAQPDFDLVLLDLALGDADGFDVLVEFRASYPALPVVVVSASDRTSDVIRAIDLGAMGFVPKRASNDTLFEALRMVMSGGIYVPPMTMGAEQPSERYGNGLGAVRQGASEGGFQTAPAIESLGLTPRQTGVLGLLLKGQPNKLIARELGLSVETVKDHVAAVLRALNVSTRTQAVLAVSQMAQQPGGLGALRRPR